MDRIKLINHVKQGDTFYTPYTNPKGMGAALSISSWSRSWLPEFLWIGLILKKIGRKNGLEKLYKIIRKLQDNKICVPQFSEIAKVDTEKQKLYWEIVSHYIDKSVLAPLTVIITPDVNEVFYNLFFDFNENIDEKISDMFVVIKECNTFHDELTTDICFVVDWFYALNGRLNILSELSSLPEALTKYYKYNHEDEAMRLYRPIIRSLFQGLCNNDNDCKNFSSLIWTRLGKFRNAIL